MYMPLPSETWIEGMHHHNLPSSYFSHSKNIKCNKKNFSSIDLFCHELIFSVLSQRTKNYMFRSELSSTDWEQGTSPDVLIGARNFI